MWFRKCVKCELILETFASKMCSNHITKRKKNKTLQVKKVNQKILESEQEILLKN